jgi:hypothetical protein
MYFINWERWVTQSLGVGVAKRDAELDIGKDVRQNLIAADDVGHRRVGLDRLAGQLRKHLENHNFLHRRTVSKGIENGPQAARPVDGPFLKRP